ncbi:hypothetical protein DF027_31960 [Burkholderia cenocepacia]|nr:hypothetical protein DF027_31960 [Burkholderia cenocepacia]RQV32720.1 hypothetical protein DF028_31780 [Burkholderia cenocepacia]RQV73024.1 hypothetical protein DF010_24580 [Burkholderia cenocepacia]
MGLGLSREPRTANREPRTANQSTIPRHGARPRAKCQPPPRKRRLASCISPDASVQAAAPCQNSRSSSRRSGAPSFSFLRSQELPCRHCSGLV